MDGVKRSGLEILGMKNVQLNHLREIWADIPHYGHCIDEQVEINAHYSGYLPKQESDIKTFKKDESLLIPNEIDYDSFQIFLLLMLLLLLGSSYSRIGAASCRLFLSRGSSWRGEGGIVACGVTLSLAALCRRPTCATCGTCWTSSS